jgi:hypothetical protein
MNSGMRLAAHLFDRLLGWKRVASLSALASIGGLVAWLASVGSEPVAAARRYHETNAALGGATLSIAVLVLGVATLREERDLGTLPYLYLKPIARPVFAVAAWAAGTAAALVVALVGWLVGWLGSVATTGLWSEAVPALPTLLVAAVGYSALFVPLGYLVPRAVLVGLGYVFVWEGVVATLVPGLAQTSIWRIAVSVYADLTPLPKDALDVLGPLLPGMWGGLAKVGGAAAAGILVLWWALRKRDAV